MYQILSRPANERPRTRSRSRPLPGPTTPNNFVFGVCFPFLSSLGEGGMRNVRTIFTKIRSSWPPAPAPASVSALGRGVASCWRWHERCVECSCSFLLFLLPPKIMLTSSDFVSWARCTIRESDEHLSRAKPDGYVPFRGKKTTQPTHTSREISVGIIFSSPLSSNNNNRQSPSPRRRGPTLDIPDIFPSPL
jgi:hypothetical protein